MKLERITMGVLAVVISVVVSAATAAEPKWVVAFGVCASTGVSSFSAVSTTRCLLKEATNLPL